MVSASKSFSPSNFFFFLLGVLTTIMLHTSIMCIGKVKDDHYLLVIEDLLSKGMEQPESSTHAAVAVQGYSEDGNGDDGDDDDDDDNDNDDNTNDNDDVDGDFDGATTDQNSQSSLLSIVNNIDGQNDNAQAPGQLFAPGSLSLDRKETIARCYVGKKGHYQEKRNTSCLHVPQHNWIFYLQPKSASSTLRKIFEKSNAFGKHNSQDRCENVLRNVNKNNHIAKDDNNDENRPKIMVITRDPIDRFVSGYKEVIIHRSTLFDDRINHERAKRMLPEIHYTRMVEEIKDFDNDMRMRLKNNPTRPEDMAANAKLFEHFVQDYDGKAFDTHLVLQMSRMWTFDKNAKHEKAMRHFDAVIDVNDVNVEIDKLAQQVGVKPPGNVVTRSHVDLVESSALSDATIQKLCRILARDYCCLNYELPAACRDQGQVVMCEWVSNPEQGPETVIKHVLSQQ